ncbi:helix-turn-helix domain-containing protein [Gordonia sp. ABSL11-1]|nr:helix-turn-helix domain-containing protein [Gordonia sp. ABSL11-1]MDL9945961.1 helix-turn-helix domain-containing protein [Gordonia sp. ABSL11-1]
MHDGLRLGQVQSVTDAALKRGFTHSGRFAAAFRQKYGMSPSQVRRDL